MTPDEVRANIAGAADAQERLEAAIAGFDDEAMTVDSLCEGWTRGHVLSHVARNADGLANLCHWAITGEVTPMYESLESRNGDIADGATRPAAEIIDDVTTSGARFLAALDGLATAVADDPSLVEVEVRLGSDVGPPILAGAIPLARRKEVEIHHVDLASTYRWPDWPQDFVDQALPDVWTRMSGAMTAAPVLIALTTTGPRRLVPGHGLVTVTGGPAALLGWLLGRATDDDLAALEVTPDGHDLPSVPPY